MLKFLLTAGMALQAVNALDSDIDLPDIGEGVVDGTTIWQTRRLSICFENPEGEEVRNQWVRSAIERTWGSASLMKFTGWGKCGPEGANLRIWRGDGWPQVSDFGSDLDNVPRGIQLNYDWSGCGGSANHDCVTWVAVHEFGHALGFHHEQNRGDIVNREGCLHELYQGNVPNELVLTPYDAESIMNYCASNWTNNGQLTEFDKQAMMKLYGPPQNHCVGGSVELDRSPDGHIVVCKGPDETTCEKDFEEKFCPVGTHQCTVSEFNAHNDGMTGRGPSVLSKEQGHVSEYGQDMLHLFGPNDCNDKNAAVACCSDWELLQVEAEGSGDWKGLGQELTIGECSYACSAEGYPHFSYAADPKDSLRCKDTEHCACYCYPSAVPSQLISYNLYTHSRNWVQVATSSTKAISCPPTPNAPYSSPRKTLDKCKGWCATTPSCNAVSWKDGTCWLQTCSDTSSPPLAPVYGYEGSVMMGHPVRALSEGQRFGDWDLGKGAFDTYFQDHVAKMFLFTCPSCNPSHQRVVYKRLTSLPSGWSLYDNVINTWGSPGNVLNTDFKLYSSVHDAVRDLNAWQFCNYDDQGIAFPRDCGPTGSVGSQWISRNNRYNYYPQKDWSIDILPSLDH